MPLRDVALASVDLAFRLPLLARVEAARADTLRLEPFRPVTLRDLRALPARELAARDDALVVLAKRRMVRASTSRG
jgi:hypothetical protein